MNHTTFNYPDCGTPRGYNLRKLPRHDRESWEEASIRADDQWGAGNWQRVRRHHARWWLFWVKE